MMAVAELSTALNLISTKISKSDLLVLAPLLLFAAYFGDLTWLIVVYGVGIMYLVSKSLSLGTEDFVSRISKSIFALTYIPFMAAFVLIMLNQEDGHLRILAFILLTVASDTGAYFAGILFGKRPMAAKISPAKTWEGFVGGLALQLTMGALVFHFFFDKPIWLGMLIGAALTVTAVLGDLLESAIKRDAGIKDMSGFLPGHGGVLDRLDSLIPNALMAWALFSWVLA